MVREKERYRMRRILIRYMEKKEIYGMEDLQNKIEIMKEKIKLKD